MHDKHTKEKMKPLTFNLKPSTVFYRPTWAEIDLDAIRYNFSQVKNIVKGTIKVLVVVKADAYGHGASQISKALIKEGVDYLGVAAVDEAIQLRQANIKKPILILSNILAKEADIVVRHDITQTVCTPDIAKLLNRSAKKQNKIAKVHIKVDTGMGRLGVWHERAFDFIKDILHLKNIKIEGIYTHLASADEDDAAFTHSQIEKFSQLIDNLLKHNIHLPLRHAANSMGVISFKNSHLNLVRPGLMIYGLYPRLDIPVKLHPAMSFKTKIIYLKETPPGRTISYGRTHVTKTHTKIATIPVGYADGYNRLLSNKAQVLVRGTRCPVVGRVCMDHTMIDVGSIKDVRVGDEVVLMGNQGKERITAEELANLCGTIPYEIVCWVSKRVPRVYKNV